MEKVKHIGPLCDYKCWYAVHCGFRHNLDITIWSKSSGLWVGAHVLAAMNPNTTADDIRAAAVKTVVALEIDKHNHGTRQKKHRLVGDY